MSTPPGQNPRGQLRDPVLRMSDDDLAVEPGSQVSTTVTVYNASAVVEEFGFEVLGAGADFAQVMPDRVSLMPGDETTVEVLFTPPAGPGTAAGTLPFGVRAVSGVDDYYATVVEGTLNLGAVHGMDARLVAVTGEHRWVGRYRAEFTNNGTAPVIVELETVAAAEDLGFAMAPPELELDPGESGEAYVKVRPSAPFLMGAPRRHQFQLAYRRHSDHDAGVDPTAHGTLDGTFTQHPVASRRLLMAGALAVGAVVALIALLPSPAPPAAAAVPPQTPEPPNVEALGPDTLLVEWNPDGSATGYRLDQLLTGDGEQARVVDSANVGAERTAHQFEGLEPSTEHCFQVVAVNDAGPSDPSAMTCAATPAAPTSEAPTAPAGGAGEAGGGGAGGATEPGGAGGDGGAGGANEPGGGGIAPSDVPAGGGVGAGEVEGAHVLYNVFPVDDPANELAAQEMVASLQAAGTPAELADSRDFEVFSDGLNGLWVVYRDGFASQQEAIAHCNEVRTIAPRCFAVPPR